MTDHSGICITQGICGSNVLFGNYEKVNRRLGMNVFKGKAQLILVNNPGRQLSFNDPAKEAHEFIHFDGELKLMNMRSVQGRLSTNRA